MGVVALRAHRWTIDHEQRMPATGCEGDIARREIEEFLGAVAVTGTMPCRKLLDDTISREARAARGWLAAQAS